MRRTRGQRDAGIQPSGAAMRFKRTVGPCMAAISLLLPALSPTAHATGDMPIKIEKTFDFGPLIEHTVTVERGLYRVSMRLIRRRESKDSLNRFGAHLTYEFATTPGTPPMTAPIFKSLLADMMEAFYGKLGTDLHLDSLSANGFMGIRDVEQKGILAFDGFAPWKAYLDDPGAFTQKEIHAIVRDRWQSSGVFETILAAFAPLGYRAVFAGFEKLFVFPAEKCSFYRHLEDFGIRKSDRFPYPGTLFFTLMPKP